MLRRHVLAAMLAPLMTTRMTQMVERRMLMRHVLLIQHLLRRLLLTVQHARGHLLLAGTSMSHPTRLLMTVLIELVLPSV